MQTPTGTYNVLRQKHYEVDIDSVFLHYSYPTSHWVFVQAQSMKMHQYRWYANGIGYMLVQMQMDSTNSYVKSVGWYAQPAVINEIKYTTTTLVYPNPSTLQVNFLCSDKKAKAVTVFDITGRKIIYSLLVNGKTVVNTGWLGKGIYLYNVTDAYGNILNRGKFSVQ